MLMMAARLLEGDKQCPEPALLLGFMQLEKWVSGVGGAEGPAQHAPSYPEETAEETPQLPEYRAPQLEEKPCSVRAKPRGSETMRGLGLDAQKHFLLVSFSW